MCIRDRSVNEPNFYLKHKFDKTYSAYGCPYVQENCDVQKPSDNIIIYGHHMNDGSMFTGLMKYRNKSFWEGHKTITFDTLTDRHQYEVIAVFKTVVYTCLLYTSANRDPKALITTMLDVSPVEVAATDELPYPNMAAFYNNEKQTLYVKRNVGDSVAVAQCVAQELGHAQLSINSESYSRRDMGFQAVCILSLIHISFR